MSTGQVMCALLKMKSFVRELTVRLPVHISQCKHTCLCIVSSWMSLVCHRLCCPSALQIMSILICTYLARLMPAWHSNFTAQSQVCSVSAGTSKPGFLYQIKREKYSSELLNSYMTDRLADETEGKETEKEERTKIGILKMIDAKDNFMWGDYTKKYWHKIWLQGLWRSGQNCWNCSSVLFCPFFKAPKVIPGNPSDNPTFITFNLTHDDIYLTVEFIAFVFPLLWEDKLRLKADRVENLAATE